MTKLPPQSNIELQIRAKCSLTNHSVWSETCYFSSGYTIPFTENFSGNALPAGWSCKTGALADQQNSVAELRADHNGHGQPAPKD